MKNQRKTTRKRRKKIKAVSAYPFEVRLRVVKLFIEEGYGAQMLHEELRIGKSTITKWVKNYREYGEEGLKPKVRIQSRSRVPGEVKQTIIDIKKDNPTHGNLRIADILKRFFLIRTSPKTIGKTLKEEGLASKSRKKPRRNISKPRFFERASPNQLWQSDIMTFRLAGKNAYLIGYIDDYSRYITSLGLYRSQTAVNVIETYRTGIAEYGVPKEMLTDNGRQYTNGEAPPDLKKS